MTSFLPTIILRHRRENKKKCTLSPLHSSSDFLFFDYPLKRELPDLTLYFVLDMEGPQLTAKDAHLGVCIIDGTWKLAKKMSEVLPPMQKRSLPKEIITAYPRKQTDCLDPQRGLASIEALYCAYRLMGKDSMHLLEQYHWKLEFLEKNKHLFH